ncbi:hypothetical protein GCM10027562_42500 [Arthrobacter pigmenti]
MPPILRTSTTGIRTIIGRKASTAGISTTVKSRPTAALIRKPSTAAAVIIINIHSNRHNNSPSPSTDSFSKPSAPEHNGEITKTEIAGANQEAVRTCEMGQEVEQEPISTHAPGRHARFAGRQLSRPRFN